LLSCFWRRSFDSRTIYAACLVAGFLLFCVDLKWQPWNSRLHLPLFVLLAGMIGVTLSSVRLRRAAYVLALILGASGILVAIR
jgi:FtsH-binding integral membrane protein